METIKSFNALGVLSGSAIDGVDIAQIKTDGVDVYEYGRMITVPYEDELRRKIKAVLGMKPDTPENIRRLKEVERELTESWAQSVKEYMENRKFKSEE